MFAVRARTQTAWTSSPRCPGHSTPLLATAAQGYRAAKAKESPSRAVLKDSPILRLDEATSALDTASEFTIQSVLERLMQNCTVIAIAHPLSTLQTFDRIVVINRGRVIQDGSPTDLATVPGIYRETLARQRRRMASPEAS